MKKLLYLMLLTTLVACKEEGSVERPAPQNSNLEGYQLLPVKGTNISRALKKGFDNLLLEEGFVKNNKREGSWVFYHKGSDFPKTQASYVDGVLNGPYIEYDKENKIILLAWYQNNLLHGKWFRYQYGQLAFSAEYSNGKLNGIYREYRGEGKVAKEITYVNGELDGPYRFFDDAGNVVLEYSYRKGKKIGD